MKTLSPTGCVGVAIALALAAPAAADVPRTQPDLALQQLADRLEPYKDVAYALDKGYIRASGCETHPTDPAQGAMGHHYVRPDLLGLGPRVNGKVNGTGTYTDTDPPAILLYIPDGDGGFKLAGIEMLVFFDAWHAQNTRPPNFRGREYNLMVDNPDTLRDEAHGFTPHYDLHIWLFEHNPSGLYAQWNPALSCPAGEAH